MQSVIRNQFGKVTVWAMLACLAMLGLYLKIGKPFLAENMSSVLHTIIAVAIGVIALFTAGCVVNLILIGNKSNREQRRDLRKQLEELHSFINESYTKISDLEISVNSHRKLLRPRSVDCLAEARRIVASLNQRIADVEAHISRSNTVDLIDAYELLNSDLSVREDCMSSLIAGNPIPPLPPKQWLPTVLQLLDEVDTDLQRLAA